MEKNNMIPVSTRSILAAVLAAFLMLMAPCRAPAEDTPLFGLATGLGSIGDDSYNDMLYNGMVLARAKLDVSYLVETPRSVEDDIPIMEALISRGCSVVIAGGGYHMIEPVQILSAKYPEVTFVLMDDVAASYPPNVASVTFRQNEGSFLAGALAALVSETGRIGFLGAADIPVINDFLVGYRAGARHVRPEIVLDVAYISEVLGADGNPFEAPQQGRDLAQELYGKGCDVVFSVAAGSNKGVFQAAKASQAFAIGVDSDQDHMAKGYVLTSMLKRLDTAILLMVEKILDGTLKNRNFSLGLKEDGVGLSNMTYTRMLIPRSVQQTLAILEQEIVAGEITVPTTMPQAHKQ